MTTEPEAPALPGVPGGAPAVFDAHVVGPERPTSRPHDPSTDCWCRPDVVHVERDPIDGDDEA